MLHSAAIAKPSAFKWGTSIAFTPKPISATVGYEVTYSASRTFSYQFPVARGETKVVRYKDWYHVTNMDIYTEWWKCDIKPWVGCSLDWVQNGKGWGAKWYQRIFRAVRV